MTRTIADQYLAQNAGRRYPFRDDTELPDWLPDSGVLDFRCTMYGVGAGTAPEARLVNVAHVGDGNVRFTVDLSAGGVVVDTIQFLVPSDLSPEPYTAYASGDRSTGALTVTAAAIPPSTEAPPYDYEVEYLESTGTQWIDTGVSIDDNDYVITSDMQIPLSPTSRWGRYFGTYTSESAMSTRVIAYDLTNNYVYVGYRRASSSQYCLGVSGFFGIRITIKLSYKHIEVIKSGRTLSVALLGNSGGADNSTMRLFGNSARVYGFGITHQQGSVIDLIPVRFTNELGQSEGAMYDRVSGQLFRNANTAANAAPFNYGNDVAPAPAPRAGEYPVDIPLAATTVVCDSLKVMSLKSAHDAADALDGSDPAGRDPVSALTGEIVLAEGRNAEPYLDGSRLRLDIRKGAGLGENCQAMTSSQTCDNVLFTINGERPGSDGDIRISGENGISVTARPDEHAITIKLDDVARDRLAKECASACNGG